MFNVIRKYNYTNSLKYECVDSLHLLSRYSRLAVYKEILSTDFIECFIVDTGHKNGLEIHCINIYGLIYIYNKSTMKFITVLNPRPSQIKRYYRALELTISKEIRKCIQVAHSRNIDQRLNEV